MSDIKLQIKRGQSINLSDIDLEAGEPAFTLDTGKLYIGNGFDKIEINPDLGTAAQKDTGTGSGNIPVLDSNGKLQESILPDLVVTKDDLDDAIAACFNTADGGIDGGTF